MLIWKILINTGFLRLHTRQSQKIKGNYKRIVLKAFQPQTTLLLFEGICGHWNGNFTLRGHLASNHKGKSTVQNQNK